MGFAGVSSLANEPLKDGRKPGGVGKAVFSSKRTKERFGGGLVSVSSAQARAGEEG